jgi:sensor domain CHASE-containing protein
MSEEEINTALQQMEAMRKLMETQMQVIQMQMQQQNNNNTNNNAGTPTNQMATPTSVVKHVKVPEGRYDMNSNDFRTFS